MIVTTRARFILFLAVVTVFSGLFGKQPILVQLGTATLLWVGLEWGLFRFRADSFTRYARCTRSIRDRQGTSRILWSGRPVKVTTTLVTAPCLRFLPATWVTIHDLRPSGVICEKGGSGIQVSFGQQAQSEMKYTISTRSIGAIRFAGLRCILRDQTGFFHAERFIDLPQKVRVLPLSQPLRTQATFRKPQNAMPPPGIHSNIKAGAGSELLEIRDYVPGDPPRSIAWKVSARRGALMTKQFESEVPIRCQMFVDMSPAARIGYPGLCLAQRLAEIAASVSHLLVSNRDAVGMSIFDGQAVRIMKCSANRRANYQMMDMLSQSIDRPLDPVAAPVASLLRQAYDVVRVRYPEAVHYVGQKSFGWIPSWPKRRMREGLAAILCCHYGLDELSMGELVEHEPSLSYWLQRFLTDHQVPFSSSRYTGQGEYLFADQHKIRQLSRLLTHASVRARDSELFVVLAELTDYDYDMGPLLRAIKMVVARGHRVAVLCAWPSGLPLIEQKIQLEAILSQVEFGIDGLLVTRQRAVQYSRIRTELGRLNVPVAAALKDIATPLIASQLALVRGGRARG